MLLKQISAAVPSITSAWRSLAVAVVVCAAGACGSVGGAADWAISDDRPADRELSAYFAAETERITEACLADVQSLEDWNARRDEYRRQLYEMLGLDPLPERTDLQVTVTGTVEHDEFFVDNLHYQSMPGLYVTGNLYRPKKVDGKLPAILYVCGHGRVVKDGVSYGNKTHYQHHGGWFARNGYVCLTIDTIQLGEIEGIHHGTYREGMWWWNSRGYSPAGVEAWNCIRALDLLQAREDVDPERLGVTGRSGGGAYSWWIAALDERIKAAVPVAGITSMHNHVVDGCIEGHCDCMFMVNTYQWDFSLLASLVAPRPLLISNTDKDRIFPLDGVVDTYVKTRRIYELHDKLDNIGLQITEGPHSDTQELRIHAFHWMNKHLKGTDPLIETAAVKFFEPPQLKVFESLPADERTSHIHDSFVPVAAVPEPPADAAEWATQRDAWKKSLLEKSFRAWPADTEPAVLRPVFDNVVEGVRLQQFELTTQEHVTVPLYVATPEGTAAEDLDLIVLNVLDESGWADFASTYGGKFPSIGEGTDVEASPEKFESQRKMFERFRWGMAFLPPRGIGPTAWSGDEKKQVQIRRRFALLGQTIDGMRVWDVRRAIQAIHSGDRFADVPLWIQGERNAAGWGLYAALFEPNIARLDLHELPASHAEGPTFLNVLRFLDLPQGVAMVAETTPIKLYATDSTSWSYPQAVAESLDWDAKRIDLRKPVADE